MDQISRIRFKNVLDRFLVFCDNADKEEEKASLLRIGVVMLNKLRIHVDVDSLLGQDIRDLNLQVASCTGREQIVMLMWDEVVGLLRSYRDAFA
ncbi:hypothetical protein LCGC14_0244520 [marine sediment metagenome]|uniref:Uncharacterized protein n=1 Tax=marine sediment metagenome TaxID=412755 RepID=A0A0F9U6M1_9ZZZZ